MPFLLISYTMEREEYLQKCGCDVCRGRLMRCAYGSSFTVGTAVMPRDHYAALQAEKLCRDAPVLGGASNTLPLKDIPLAIVTENFRGIIPGGAELYVYGGQSLHSVCAFAAAAGLSGIEELCGIPGSIGGAAAGNSGCFGRELSDVLVYADVGSGGRAERVYAKDAGFSYRKSALKEKGLILGVMLRLTPSDSEKIRKSMELWQKARAASQPGRPSLGSTFKKVGSISAAEYIEKAGFKGAREGGAQVSPKHAGFIVNTGGGSAEDYFVLAEKVRAGVEKSAGVLLDYEIEILK